jgi:AraC family transcriptional activator of mtrCDE
VDGRLHTITHGGVRKFSAGGSKPEIILICGYFNARYGASVELFSTLTCPIVEQFGAGDQLDRTLKSALTELVAQEVGSGAMSAALLKQVIVALLRRSLRSKQLWLERFSMFGDARIARAFADMAAQPGAPHTVVSLAQSACMSRSAFMTRFKRLVGCPPMSVLRDLRMRQAARHLAVPGLSIDQIAHNAGYGSRTSFVRAFRKTYGTAPKMRKV